MSQASFGHINAGLLARKGEAHPSKEPKFGSTPWQPPVTPSAPPVVAPPGSVGDMKVRYKEVEATWPSVKRPRPAESDLPALMPGLPPPPLNSYGEPIKTTIRLTHAQARAVKLAALVLDRPQQEILTAGLLGRLEALACADLANCACFKTVLEGLKKPEPGEPV